MIPHGQVATYGQIATLLGQPRAARAVGYALHMTPRNSDIPWHRVINAQGRISAKSEVERPIVQRFLLEKEGIKFDEEERVDLERLRWEGPDAKVLVELQVDEFTL